MNPSAPELAQIQAELQRRGRRTRRGKILWGVLLNLLAVAACAVLIFTLWLPILRVYGASMGPTLESGDLVLVKRTTAIRPGDVVAFYVGEQLLIKRCVAGPGTQVDIDENGVLYLDGEKQDEPYLTAAQRGECDVELPYTVPEGRWFVLGDRRSTSIDSRSSAVGCVAEEQIVGKVIFRLWPLSRVGGVS